MPTLRYKKLSIIIIIFCNNQDFCIKFLSLISIMHLFFGCFRPMLKLKNFKCYKRTSFCYFWNTSTGGGGVDNKPQVCVAVKDLGRPSVDQIKKMAWKKEVKQTWWTSCQPCRSWEPITAWSCSRAWKNIYRSKKTESGEIGQPFALVRFM